METQSTAQERAIPTIYLQGIRIEGSDRDPFEAELDAFLNLLTSIAQRASMEGQTNAA